MRKRPIALYVLRITAIPWQFVAVTRGLFGALLLAWHAGSAWYLARRKTV